MQKSPPTAGSSLASIFSTNLFASSSTSLASSRPNTRDGPPPPLDEPPPVPSLPPDQQQAYQQQQQQQHGGNTADAREREGNRKPSFSRHSSFSVPRRRNNSAASATSGAPVPSNAVVTNADAPPALPDYALAAAARISPRERDAPPQNLARIDTSLASDGGAGADSGKQPTSPASIGRPLSRTATGQSGTVNMSGGAPLYTPALYGPPPGAGATYVQNENNLVHQQITDVANKRISTLDYLRKAHESRMYWFNTYLFDRPDLNRMPYFDPRKLARRATNYLLLGLSIPTISDLYSSTPLEFLRSLNTLLSEFDSFQQLHGDASTSSLSRARLPNMFRRPGKPRRSTTASSSGPDFDDAGSSGLSAGGAGLGPAPAVMNFAASESDLLPGEEYSHLLTPSLPFEPDFFETFATLCDVLIDCYTRFLALIPTTRECSVPVAELFSKADSKIRKIIVQGAVKEFEEHTRSHIKGEVAGIGRVVLGGLM